MRAAWLLLLALLVAGCDRTGPADTFSPSPADALAAEILEQRGEPLRQIAGLRPVNLRDFGAVPDSGENAWEAIRAAVREISAHGGGAELVFEPGRYVVDPGNGPYGPHEESVMELRGLRDVIIDGRGAEIVIERPSIGFVRIRDAENVIVRNFTIDYDPLPFTQGDIVAVDREAKSIDVRIDAGYPGLDEPIFAAFGTWGMLKDPAVPGKLKDGADNVVFTTGFERVSPGLYRVRLRDRPGDILEPGDRWAQITRAAGGCQFFHSNHVTFENITFHAAPSSLFVGAATSHLAVLRCRGLLTGDRLVLNGGDGVHCQAARVGPWVEGCEFQGLSDDCLNIYSLPNHILEAGGGRRFRLSHANRIQPGDRLAFFRPQTGEVLLETTASGVDGDWVTVACDVPPLNLAPAGTPFADPDARDWKVYDHIYNLDATGNHFVYRDNTLRDGRRYGGFFKASHGLIENNRFERLSDYAIMVQNEPGWPEGFWARHLVIRDNTVLDCGFLPGRVPVKIGWSKLGHQSAGLPLQADIHFENNRVRAVSGPAARFECIDGLTLRGNRFESGSETGPLAVFADTTLRLEENNTDRDRFVFE